MTGNELFNQALALTGYGGTALVDASDIKERALSIINAVYSDIYFLTKKDGFQKLSSLENTLDLTERETVDCAVYGVAKFLAKLLGTDDDYKVFSSIYCYKKTVISRKSGLSEVDDIFAKGEC